MRIGIFMTSAILAAGCRDPARQAITAPATPGPTSSPATATIGGPEVPHLFPGGLRAVANLRALGPITAVTVTPSLNASQAPPPSAAALPAVLASSIPLSPSDPTIDQWQYAPWYTATFTAGGRRWSLDTYLGGLGLLADDAGHRAMVRLPPHTGDGT